MRINIFKNNRLNQCALGKLLLLLLASVFFNNTWAQTIELTNDSAKSLIEKARPSRPNNKHTVTFDCKGGTDPDSNFSFTSGVFDPEPSAVCGETLKIKQPATEVSVAPEGKPVRKDYAFKGWCETDTIDLVVNAEHITCNGEELSNNSIISEFPKATEITGVKKYYALWQALPKVTFNCKGGSNGKAADNIFTTETDLLCSTEPGNPTKLTLKPKEDISSDALLKPKVDPTMEGYKLIGWCEKETNAIEDPSKEASEIKCNNDKYPFDFNENKANGIKSDLTLYALWQTNEDAKHTVTFDCLGGNGDICTKNIQKIKHGQTVTQPDNPTKPNDYVFRGWCIDKNCSDYFNFKKEKITGDITLYANWQQQKISLTLIIKKSDGIGEAECEVNNRHTNQSVKVTKTDNKKVEDTLEYVYEKDIIYCSATPKDTFVSWTYNSSQIEKKNGSSRILLKNNDESKTSSDASSRFSIREKVNNTITIYAKFKPKDSKGPNQPGGTRGPSSASSSPIPFPPLAWALLALLTSMAALGTKKRLDQ